MTSRFVHPTPASSQPSPVFAPPEQPNLQAFFQDHLQEENEILRKANAYFEALDDSDVTNMFYFGGLPALTEWRRRYSSDFLRLTKPFLARAVKSPDQAFHLASLIHASLCNLLAIEPDEAYRFYQKFMNWGARHPF